MLVKSSRGGGGERRVKMGVAERKGSGWVGEGASGGLVTQTLERDRLGPWQDRREEPVEVGACKLGWNPGQSLGLGLRD